MFVTAGDVLGSNWQVVNNYADVIQKVVVAAVVIAAVVIAVVLLVVVRIRGREHCVQRSEHRILNSERRIQNATGPARTPTPR